MIDVKTMTAEEMIEDAIADGKKFSPDSPYPYAFGGLSTYVRWLAEERDRLQGIVTAYEFRDEDKMTTVREVMQAITESRGEG